MLTVFNRLQSLKQLHGSLVTCNMMEPEAESAITEKETKKENKHKAAFLICGRTYLEVSFRLSQVEKWAEFERVPM